MPSEVPSEGGTKAALGRFLSRNPFPHGLTDGLFYREKMRAIHRVAPDVLGGANRPIVLEIGGGRSGLAQMLYPGAAVVTSDIDFTLSQAPSMRGATFVCGDACRLPFADGVFDLVTMFDVLEHIQDHATAAAEAKRVLRSGGTLLVSCPNADWRFPSHGFMRPIARSERELMAEWGHVRRGYTRADMAALLGATPDRVETFINRATALFHDIAFSRLQRWARLPLYAAAAPVAALGYALPQPSSKGTETAYAWRF